MIRQAAFVANNKMLKGGLHCHTTRSDGYYTPEVVIKLYKDNGYDFLSITDHRRYNFLNYAPEIDLTILPGMEYDNGGSIPCSNGFRCFHTVCVGPSKEEGNDFEQDILVPSAKAPTQEEYQPYLDEIHARKNLTVYCHPQWSSTPPRYFDKMKGNFAMEIWNSNCVINHDMDVDAMYWDDLLGRGIRIFGVASDDGHLPQHYCKGWVMVNAENNVNAILKALSEGAFYSSTGPEIYDFYYEDGKLVIDCSPVKKIRIHSDCHPTNIYYGADNEPLTHGVYNIKNYSYVRVSVVDEQGRCAWTNPIFLD